MGMITTPLMVGAMAMALTLGPAGGDHANDCVSDPHISNAINRLKKRMPDAQITVVDCDPRPGDERKK